jgi:hypothetical protein
MDLNYLECLVMEPERTPKAERNAAERTPQPDLTEPEGFVLR